MPVRAPANSRRPSSDFTRTERLVGGPLDILRHFSSFSNRSESFVKPFFETDSGKLYWGRCEDVLRSPQMAPYKGKVQLIFTSPPFPLNRKKKYGNLTGPEYLIWFSRMAAVFKQFLRRDGSIVVEIGNSWQPGEPTQSILPTQSLLAFLQEGQLKLCQEITYYNPARLPSPAQWVNIERIRLKDATTKVWWMAPSSRPKANNRNVLNGYSAAMLKLIETQKYNAGARPSEHHISEAGFMKNNGGSISANLIECANTSSSDPYLKFCRSHKIKPHPARMPLRVPEFFIKFLTDEDDLVLDPFGGSNTTGYSAERLGRRWISIEADRVYAACSVARFLPERASTLLANESSTPAKRVAEAGPRKMARV
jgi:DNA modification methylase